MADLTVRLIIRNRDKLLRDEHVRAVTSINARGVFDVLAEHANFISLIKEYLIIHKTDGGKEEMKLDGGLMRVGSNEVQVFIGLATTKPNQSVLLITSPQK